MRCFIFLFLLTYLSIGHSAQIVGDDLIGFFSATCRSQGELTRQTLNDSYSLITVLENIKNDPDCSTISGGISQLSNLQSKLLQLAQFEDLGLEVERLTAQENEIMIQVGQESDPGIIEQLNSSIRSVQVDKAGIVAEISQRQLVPRNTLRDLYSQLVTSSNSLFNTVSSNYRCLERNPNILPAVASFVGAIGSAAIAVNPALGLGISAATDFIGNTVEALRKGRLNRKIRKIADSGAALEGYKCALESLSQRWCELKDAESFIGLKSKLRREDLSTSGFGSAIRLFDRDIPVLLSWLNNVRTGVRPSTTADARRQKEVFDRDAAVRSARSLGNGIIAQNRPLFESFETPKQRYSVVLNVISELTGISCGGLFSGGGPSPGPNPLLDVYNQSYAPFYLLGLPGIPRQGDFNINFCQFDPFLPGWEWPTGTYEPSLDAIEMRYEEWIRQARELVNRELTLVLQPDPIQVLASAFESTNNKWKYSTVDAIQTVKRFIQIYGPDQNDSKFFGILYRDTISRLETLEETIESAMKSKSQSISAKEALEKIYEVTELQYGPIVLETRLEMVVRISLFKYLKTFSEDENGPVSQLLAADSFIEVLSQVSGTDNLTMLSMGVQRAMPIAIGNMTAFAEVFGRNINRILKKNHLLLKKTGDSSLQNVYSSNASQICLLLSSLPKWPSKIEKHYCLNSRINEVLPRGPKAPLIDTAYLNQDFDSRACGYRDFLRKSRIYQDWGIQN